MIHLQHLYESSLEDKNNLKENLYLLMQLNKKMMKEEKEQLTFNLQ